MHDKRQFREALEACRPGSDDLSLPEMASAARRVAEEPSARDLYERTQKRDALLGEAFQNVPLPSGLEDRLLAALAAADSLTAAAISPNLAETSSAVLASAESPEDAPVELARPRRAHFGRWLFAASLAAAALLAGVVTFQMFVPAAPLGPQQVLELASLSHDEAFDEEAAWNADLAAAPAARPFSRSLQVRPLAWQRAEGFDDSSAVAYQLNDKATLLVFAPHREVVGLPASPPLSPQHSSGRSVGAWTSGDLVYALVVEGPPAAYQSLVKPSAGLAMQLSPAKFH